MVEYIQQEHNKHARRRRELAEKASDTVESVNFNDAEVINLDVFRGCHYKELHSYNKNKHYRQGCSQGDEINNTRGQLTCDRTTWHSAIYQCKQFESQRTHSEPSIASRRKQTTRYETKTTLLQNKKLKGAKKEIIGQPISFSSTPGITATSSSPSHNLTLARTRKSFSMRNLWPIKDRSSVRRRLKKSPELDPQPNKQTKTNKTSVSLTPKRSSKRKSRRQSFLIAYSKILFLHNKRRIKPKLQNKNRGKENEIKSIVSPAIPKINKRKPHQLELDRLTKIQGNSLRVNLSSNSTFVSMASDYVMRKFCDQGEQSLTKCISFPKPINTPYAKTITVYSVFGQSSAKRKPAVNLTSNASFNVKFYKSMGDGRQMFGDSSPYMQLPRNYSPTDVARGGRDEDGCICVCIPQENDYGYMGPRYGGSFLKRYLRVLLKENKRCVCANRRSIQRSHPCGNYGPNAGRGRIMMPSDYYNSRKNLQANDVSCQCKRKERRERRSDDIFCRDRGTTCSVPTCPENNSIPVDLINALNQQQNMRDKNAVNIGSNLSFQVGLYKRCIDTNPDHTTFSPNDNYSYVQDYIGDAGYSMGRGGNDCCCSANNTNNTSAGYEHNPSILSEQLSPRYVSPCLSKSPSTLSSILKQLESSDLNERKSRSKPKHKAVRCKCNKKPKIIGCSDSKKHVGIVCSSAKLSSSAASSSCNCYKVKNIGCCCSNEPILAECQNKRSSNSNLPVSKKSRKSGGICGNICVSQSKKKRKKISLCSSCNLPKDSCNGDTCRKSKKPRKKVDCCRCGEKSPKSLLECFFKREAPTCCCFNEQKFSLVRTLSILLQRSKKSKIACKCSPKSGELLDYKNLLNNLKISSRLQKQTDKQPCPCGNFNVKKVLSELLVPPEPKQHTKAQQCKCNNFDIKKTFGRLLLYNTVKREPRYSSVSYDQNSRSIGTGEEDYRKLPPGPMPDRCQGDGFALNKFVSKLIFPETSTKMRYSAFNPLNQCETAMQHNSRVGPDYIAGATVCRNQGSCVAKSKPLTLKDCENATCAALQDVDPNRRAVRIGSSCSFCLEFYRGMPPPKTGAPPSPTTCPTPCPAPCANTTTPVSIPKIRPCRKSQQPFLLRAANYMISQNQHSSGKKKPTCKKCDNCVKVPIIKRGFANLILSDKRPLQAARTCQKTNTIQPNRKLVTRKPTAGKGSLGASPKCDPYVCLKRINQRKCCK